MLPVPSNEVNLFTIYLTPFIPLSFKGEGEVLKRGAMPLLNSPLIFSSKKKRSSLCKRGFASL